MRGRKTIPTHLKLVTGTYRPDRAPKNPPEATGTLGAAPAHFNDDQRRVWADLAADAPDGLLTACDRGIFGAYCILFHARILAEQNWNATNNALLIRSDDGHRRAATNPYLREFRRLTDQMRMLEGELGFTPSSRSRINLMERIPGGSKLAKYLT